VKTTLPLSREYVEFVTELKARIRAARVSAARAVNRDLILLYWDIGRGIVERQEKLGWGKSIVEHLARDLQAEFPGSQGFSARNLWYMRCFYAEYAAPAILQQLAAELGGRGRTARQKGTALEKLQQLVVEIPWGHHMLLLDRTKDAGTRFYYLRATPRFGWTRNVLLNQIKAGAYERSLREGKAHNFPAVLPEYLAEQAEEALKSSYNLEFLGIRREVKERELEDRLIERLRDHWDTCAPLYMAQ